jgi:lysozyme
MSVAEANVRAVVEIPLTQDEFIALCDLTFNIGTGNFDGSTLLRLLNAGDIDGAIAQFSVWNKAGGKVLAGLVKRRSAEAALFRLGAHCSLCHTSH